MSVFKIISAQIKENFKFIIGCIIFGLVTTGLLVSYYVSVDKLVLESEALNQKLRAKVLVQKIDTYSAVANQISRALQEHFKTSNLSKQETEKFLIEMVKSGPSNLIYGVGIWYQPFEFNKSRRLFGSYAHRQIADTSKIILTYEWNTEAYNYPEQEWYKKGLMATEGKGVYIEPYFDAGQVYVTLSSTLLNSQKKIKGIISVDMILPQLQSLIDSINQNDEEIIYIKSRAGYILARPHRVLTNDVLTHTETISNLGWQVIVESHKSYILQDSIRLLNLITLGISILWLCLLLTIYFYIKSKNIKKMNSLKFEAQQVQLLNTSRLATLGEFSSGVAHEINNPLSIIYGKTELLIKKITSNTFEPTNLLIELQKINENSNRIAQIIRGLKSLSRDGSGDPFLKISLTELFANTFSISAERIKSKNIKFSIAEFDDVQINCRSTQISQILLNLLSNSIDSIENQPTPWILIEVNIGADVQILITDSGRGISKITAEKMMNPFFTTKEVGKGTGLGLSICQNIIAEHQGTLHYNPMSRNTQFVIRLPLHS